MAAVPPTDLGSILATIQESNTSCVVSAKLKDGSDHVCWKREMTLYFKNAGLWHVIAQDAPVRTDAIWTWKNDKALAAIHNACVSQQQDLSIDINIVKAAWDRLRTTHEARDSARALIM